MFFLPANVAQFHLRDSEDMSSGSITPELVPTRRSSIVGTLGTVAIVDGRGRGADAVNIR